MDFKPILIRKAAKFRRTIYYAYLIILLLSLFIGFLIYEGNYWADYSAHCKAGLLLAEGLILAAFILAQIDFKIKPEESADKLNLSKIRNGAFLLAGGWIVLVCVLLWPSFFFLFPLFMLVVYACCIHSVHFYFNAVQHPTAPKSILLALPVEQPLRACAGTFYLGCFLLLLSLISLIIAFLAPGIDSSFLLLALLFFIFAVLVIVPTAAAKLGHAQEYEEWLWLVMSGFTKNWRKKELTAQFPLFVWCLSNPGNPNPPLDLLMKADKEFVLQVLPAEARSDMPPMQDKE